MANKKTTAVAMTAKRPAPKFFAYLKQGDIAPYVREEKWTQDPWIHHGEDNLWPEKLRTLVDNCAPLERAITMLAKFIAGHGLRFYAPPDANGKRGPELPAAQAKFQEWMADSSEEEFLWRCAYDLAHGLGVTFNVRMAPKGETGGTIARLDHLDRFGLRSGKLDAGRVNEYWWSTDWKRYKETTSDPLYKPIRLPAWDPAKPQRISTIFRKSYRPREPYYGGLFWLGAWTAAEVWTKVDNYNRSQIDMGFTPGMVLGVPFQGTESEWDEQDEAYEVAYTGPNGKGLLTFPMAPGDAVPFFQKLDRGNHAGEIDTIKAGAADTIYSTIGIPELLMRDRAEGLTSQERAIAIRLQQMERTVVEPLRKFITQPIQQLMSVSGIECYEACFESLKVFDPAQSEAEILASRTGNESRELRGEDPTTEEWGNMPLVQIQKSKSSQQMAAEAAALDKTLAAKQSDQQPGGNLKKVPA